MRSIREWSQVARTVLLTLRFAGTHAPGLQQSETVISVQPRADSTCTYAYFHGEIQTLNMDTNIGWD